MKTSLLCGAALAILGFAAAPLIAQTTPMAGASPGATSTATASPTPTASPSAPVSAAASAGVSATVTASPKATREASATGGKAKASVTPVSPRHKGDQMMPGTSGESSAETTGSPSGKKSSHKKSRIEGAETAATPGGEQE
jgi:hypothetical protein